MILRALVTGGAGFIGSTLVDRLVDEGSQVLVIDDLSRGRLSHLQAARATGLMTFDQLDVRAPEVREAARQFEPEIVFHLAAQVDAVRSLTDPVDDAERNIVGAVNVLEAAVSAGARRLVYVSSGGAIYGGVSSWPVRETVRRHPATPYGVSKSVVDEYLRLYHERHGLEFVSLGPSNVYGPRQGASGEGGVVAVFTQRLLAGERPQIYGDGTQTRDFVYVEDVADACVRAAGKGASRYLNISTGVETTVVELAKKLAVLTNRRIDPQFEDPRPGDVSRSSLDPASAKRHLGWEPWTALDDGLAQTVDWFRAADGDQRGG